MAHKSKDFDSKTIELYDQTIHETTDKINSLKNIENPSEENIEKRFLFN